MNKSNILVIATIVMIIVVISIPNFLKSQRERAHLEIQLRSTEQFQRQLESLGKVYGGLVCVMETTLIITLPDTYGDQKNQGESFPLVLHVREEGYLIDHDKKTVAIGRAVLIGPASREGQPPTIWEVTEVTIPFKNIQFG